MANATKKIKKVFVQRTEEVDDGVTLELSKLEAQALAEVLGWVGGSPELSPRKYIHNIDEALRKLNYNYTYDANFIKSNSITFLDCKKEFDDRFSK